jgi:hypothetical protein
MSDQATPQRDEDADFGGATEESDQNREEQQQDAVPDHSEDRPTDPAPQDEG